MADVRVPKPQHLKALLPCCGGGLGGGFIAIFVLLPILVQSAAQAQFPKHRLFSVYPAGGRDGETVEVQVTGAQLDGPMQLWFDHPGLRAFHVKGPTFRVAIAPGIPPGHHDVRVLGTLGVSNPRTFVVGDRPESREKEPNNDHQTANPIAMNSSANGRMDSSADVDYYAIECKAHQRLLIELEGERIESRIDGVLALLDSKGRALAESHDGFGMDPFLDTMAPADGRYFIKVRDAVYNGSPEFGYRLTVHDGPHIDAATPAVLPVEECHEVTLIGRNLGGERQKYAAESVLERRTITIKAPSEALDPLAPSLGYLPAPWAVGRGFEFQFENLGRRSNSVFFGSAVDPVDVDKEPNDDLAHAQEIALPRDISGTFDRPGDRDCYRFSAKKGQIWIIEATAERLGSAADPTFVVQRLPDKGEPREVLANDDIPDPAPGQLFSAATVDASARWQVPENGTYQIVLSDLFGSQRGDIKLFYRLNVRPERPDFCLFVLPTNLVGDGGLTARAGGRVSATVVARRIDGFGGPIEIDAVDLPDGVTSEPIRIGPGQTQSSLILTVAPGAKCFEGPIRVVGRSRSGDRKELLDYVPGTSHIRPEIEHAALGANLVWDPQNVPVAASRVSRGVVLAAREGSPFLLSAHPSNWVVGQGDSLELTVDVERHGGFTEAVQVSTVSLPPNVPSVSASIAKDKTSAVLKVTIPKNTPAGSYSFHVNGSGAFPFSADPKAAQKPNINVVEPSNGISVTVRR